MTKSLCKNSPRKNIGLLMIGCLSRQKSRDIFYMYLFLKNLVFVQSLTLSLTLRCSKSLHLAVVLKR